MRKTPLFYLCIALVVLLAGGLMPRFQAAAEDNSAAGKNAAGIIQACEMAGGTIDSSSSSDDRTNSNHGPSSSTFHCAGGGMGGTTCTATNSGIGCTWKPPAAQSMSEGGVQEVVINAQDVTLASELPADATTPLMPDAAGTPMVVEAVITWNPSAEVADQEGVDLVNGCRLLGGTEVVAHPDGNPESASFTVQCDGGMIDGLWCAFGVGLSTCFFEPGTGQDAGSGEMPATMPTEALPGSGDDADSTPTTTTEPTATATATAPAPTVPSPDDPVIEPTAPADDDPWQLPEGTLPAFEPFDPTPTPVILT
jgi:hypothetical protein